jgi:hypothetical protein
MFSFHEMWISDFRVLIFLASFILITIFSPQVFGQDSLVNYENSQYGFKLSYPSDWDIAVNGSEIRFNSPVDNSNGFLNSIVILADPAFCESLEKLREKEIEDLKGKLFDFKLIDSSTSKLNGLNSVNLVYTYSDTNIGITKVSESIVTNQNYNYYISYSGKPDNYETDIDIYQNLLKNIDIGFGLSENTISGNQRYTDLDSNMSFSYPANWTISNEPTYFDDGSVNHFAILYSPCEKGDEYSENISFSYNVVNQSDSFLPKELLENSISYHRDTIKGFKVISSSEKLDSSLANKSKEHEFDNSYSLTFSGKLETGQNVLSTELGIITKDKFYYIQYYASPDRYNEYHQILENIISSITFDGVKDSSSFGIDTIKFHTYYSDFPSFNIKYPTDWVTDDNDPAADVGFSAVTGVNPASVQVSHEFLTTKLSLDKYTSKSLAELRNALPNFKLISNSKDVLFGNDATRLVYTITEDRKTIKLMQIFSIFGDTVYVITYVTNNENYATGLQIAQRMINSFEITGTNAQISGHYSDSISGLDIMLPDEWTGFGNIVVPGFNMSFVYPKEIIDKLKSNFAKENVRLDKIAFVGISFFDNQSEDNESTGEVPYSDYVCKQFDSKISTINNMTGMAISGECNFGQISMKVSGMIFETQNGQQIMIFYAGDPSNYKKYLNDFLVSLKSLKIPNTVPVKNPQFPFQNA